jgi:hypothetical protein
MIVESYEDVIILSGALRRNFWKTIHTAISLTLQRHPEGVIVDCSGITEATPEGAETFHDAIDFVSEHDRARIIFAAARPEVMQVLTNVPELRSQLAMAKSVDDARASLQLFEAGEEPKKKKKSAAKSFDRVIMAVLQGAPTDAQVIEVASEFVSTIPAKVVFLLPVVMPRDLALSAPMPELEALLKASSKLAETSIAPISPVVEVRLERTRNLAALTAEVSQQLSVAYTIIGLNPAATGQEEVRQLLAAVKLPLIFVRGAKAED